MIGQGVLNYYNPAANPGISKGQMALRYGVTAGAVGAGAIGARYASGGDLTHNSKGEKDIAEGVTEDKPELDSQEEE